jgi:hypothetical protein
MIRLTDVNKGVDGDGAAIFLGFGGNGVDVFFGGGGVGLSFGLFVGCVLIVSHRRQLVDDSQRQVDGGRFVGRWKC